MILTATTIQQVITQIYEVPEVWGYLHYLDSRNKEDMFAEMALQLMTKEEQTMAQYKDGIILYYVFSAFKKQTYATSSFYKKYHINDYEEIDCEDKYEEDYEDPRIKKEEFYDFAKAHCYKETDTKKKQFLLTTIFELYFEHKLSLRKIQKATSINYRSVWCYINEIKDNIKTAWKQKLQNNTLN